MACPSQLLWEVVKGHNSFVRKNLNGAVFSAEPGNLYSKHSYKYSGEGNCDDQCVAESACAAAAAAAAAQHSSGAAADVCTHGGCCPLSPAVAAKPLCACAALSHPLPGVANAKTVDIAAEGDAVKVWQS